MGELARQAGCPELATTPLELLTPRPGDGFSILQKWALPCLGAGCGILSVSFWNVSLGRPFWAGIHLHILLAGLTAYGMIYIRDSKFSAKAEVDEVYKHYITLHPEDYPPYERKRFRDVYEPFFPIR